MDGFAPFKPSGFMVALLGSLSVSPPGTLLSINGDWTALVYNRSATQDGYLVYGPTSTSVNSAVIPLVSGAPTSTSNMLPIPRSTVQSFTFSGPTYFGVLVPAGNATVDLVGGNGQ